MRNKLKDPRVLDAAVPLIEDSQLPGQMCTAGIFRNLREGEGEGEGEGERVRECV
jgi:hypothetical protein